MSLTRTNALVLLGLLSAMAATLYGQWALWNWYIEDAAISFAYARNLGDGWGPVRFPGDERVEGYSNPLWVLMLAVGHVLGIDIFDGSKYLALALAPLALIATWASVRRVGPWVGVLAAWILATDATFVIWSASGLENALFAALLATGIWRTTIEGERGGFPWAAVAFLGLSVTRPDGIAYAALGGIWALVLEATGPRRWRRILGWLAIFWVPFVAYHAVRYAYFAFPLPSTFYAKLDRTPYWWRFHSYGWTYLRRYSHETWRLWFLPVFLLGVVGHKGWRAGAVTVLTLVSFGFLMVPGIEPFVSMEFWPTVHMPSWYNPMKVGWIFGLALFTPLLGMRTEGWQVRMIAWWMAMFGLFFCLVSGGDWMRGFRWMSLVAVPLALLFAYGLHEIYRVLERVHAVLGRVAVLGLLGGVIAPQVSYQQTYKPETGPFSVNKRVKHYRWFMNKLHIDKVDIVDHDMGAMLYWGGDLGIIRDSKGLADIAFAYQEGETPFVAEYAWDEYPFDLAHAHATTGRLMPRQRKRWKEQYVDFPGYGGRKPHQGNFYRKSLVVHPFEGSEDRSFSFDGGTVHGIDMIEQASVAHGIRLDVAMSRDRPGQDFRLLLFLFDEQGVVATYNLPQGYESIYPIERWLVGEVVNQWIGIRPGDQLQLGIYRVGAVVIGPEGVLPPTKLGADVSLPETPVFAAGEVHFGRTFRLIERKKASRLALKAFDVAYAEAEENRCAEAKQEADRARRQMARNTTWWKEHEDRWFSAYAGCMARYAGTLETREEQADAMRVALKYGRTHPEVLAIAPVMTEPWYQEALQRLEAGEQEAAHALLVDVIAVDPSRSWARRHLEDLRRQRLPLRNH